jgi:phosphoribosyl-ATP pyrophosphohydrolase
MVLLAFNKIDPMDILKELERREGVSGLEEKSRR